jgi:translation initiation factor 5
MTEKVSIPRSIQDPFYRYQMPVMKIQVTGKHQGRDVVILNLKDVAKALERDTLYIMKFFNTELQSRFVCDDKTSTYQIHGNYDVEQLSQVLDRFIDIYVLCGSAECKLPETNLEITGSKLRMTCRACGKSNIIPNDHKLTNFIFKNVRPGVTIKENTENQHEVVDQQKVAWSVPTDRESVEKRKQEAGNSNAKKSDESGGTLNIEQQLLQLKELVKTDPDLNLFIASVQKFQKNFNMNDQILVMNLFMILFDTNILYQIKPFSKYLEPFVCDDKDQKAILLQIEKLCGMDKNLIDNIVHILWGFYDEDILEEDIVLHWAKVVNPKLNPKVSRAVRVNAKPFIQWLMDAEVEDDDDRL